MGDRPLVSVIIIFYNSERFLQEAVESVFAQTYTAWELLLVDDGSTDGGSELARTLAGQHPKKMRCLEHSGHENRGTGAARNLGAIHARGAYIAYLDADDVWLPSKLTEQVRLLDAEPEVGLLYGLSEYWYSWTGKPEDRGRDHVQRLGVQSDVALLPPALLTPFFITQQAAIPNPSNFIVRREILEQVGGFDAEFRSNYEDQAFLAKVILAAPVWATRRVWDRYRQRPGSTSAVSEQRAVEERIFFLKWLERYLQERGFNEPETFAELQRQRWLYQHPTARRLEQIAGRLKLLPFQAAYRLLPAPLFHRLRARWRGEEYRTPPGWVRWGSLRRVTPLSREFGYNRGQPIDRFYIESFLSTCQEDIRGRTLEVGEDTYTRRYGGQRVACRDVLHTSPSHPEATLVGDLTNLENVSDNAFDCIILTQTLQFIYDPRQAVQTCYRILKPGGVLLVTFPGLSPISRYEADRWGDFWRFTGQSARRLFEEFFLSGNVQVRAYGNVLSAAAFLYGLASAELKLHELEANDPDYEVILGVRAVKPGRDRNL